MQPSNRHFLLVLCFAQYLRRPLTSSLQPAVAQVREEALLEAEEPDAPLRESFVALLFALLIAF